MKTRVLHIIGSGTIGGAENFVYQLARYQHLYDDAVDPALLYRRGDGHFFSKAKENNITTHSCSEKIGIKEFCTTVRLFRHFDILHFHGLYPVLFIAAFVSRRSSLYFVHGARALTKDMRTIAKGILLEHEFPTSKGLERFLRRQWFKIFLKFVVKEIHAPTKFYVTFYLKKYRIPKGKVRHLPLGVDFSAMRVTKPENEIRRELGISNERIIGCVSTFKGSKRIDRLIDGFARLLSDNGGMKLKLLIVGDGAERRTIEEQIERRHIRNNILLTGFRRDIANLLNIMDVFVLPSEFENFPLSIIEAMFFKVPTIVFQRSGGAEEIIRTSGTGLIVGSAEELADTIDHLLNCTDEAGSIGHQGHQFVTSNCTLEVFATKIREAYQATLGAGKV